jgi:predicted RNase H-like HicB family nuclease
MVECREDHRKGERMAKTYTVSDGKLVLTLTVEPEGGYTVTSPFDPELITEAETVPEAFSNARDALGALAKSRAKLNRKLLLAGSSRGGA